MRYREAFTIFPRKTKSGLTVYYYRTYDAEGNRTVARSTGTTSKSAAKAFCEGLRKDNALIPAKKGISNFAEYAADFWLFDKCRYVQGRLLRGLPVGPAHCKNMRRLLVNHALPVFGRLPLNKITPNKIDSWLLSFRNSGLSNRTANLSLICLKVILDEAFKEGHIYENPCIKVANLANNTKTRGILEQSEASKLLSSMSWESIWQGSLVCYVGNLLAAVSGMRLGEIRALKIESLQYDSEEEPFLIVKHSYTTEIKATKTGESRFIVIPQNLADRLHSLADGRENGFIFTFDGVKPVGERYFLSGLYEALGRIGIDEEQRRTRNITFHSWRHFANTTYRALGVPDSKVQSITGHSTQAMTELYSHFRSSDFSDVRNAQKKLVNKFNS